MSSEEIYSGDYLLSTDASKLQFDFIHDYLSKESYWSREIPAEILQKAIDHSVCFGIYHKEKQVGFARLVTDQATFAWLADVFIAEEHRGKGLSKQLMEFILSVDFVKGLRRIMLGTRDAHGLYGQFGFHKPTYPERFMELHRPDIYAHKIHSQQ